MFTAVANVYNKLWFVSLSEIGVCLFVKCHRRLVKSCKRKLIKENDWNGNPKK